MLPTSSTHHDPQWTKANRDHKCDWVPLVSIGTNIRDLLIKGGILKLKTPANTSDLEYIKKKNEYAQIKDKSYIRCVIAAIPVLGNIPCIIYDLTHRERTEKQALLKLINSELYHDIPNLIKNASCELRDDPEIIKAAVKKDSNAFEYASERLQGNKDFMSRLINSLGGEGTWRVMKQVASKELPLTGDKDIIRAAVKKNKSAFEYASLELRNDKEFVRELFKEHGPGILKYAGDKVRNDEAFALECLDHINSESKYKTNGLVVNLSDNLLRNKNFVDKFIDKIPQGKTDFSTRALLRCLVGPPNEDYERLFLKCFAKNPDVNDLLVEREGGETRAIAYGHMYISNGYKLDTWSDKFREQIEKIKPNAMQDALEQARRMR